MIAIPPGQVTLSDRRTQHTWSVELAPYQLAAFPITQARYAQVTGQRPSTAQGDQLPVEGVSWWEAVRFCNALSQRVGPVRHAGQCLGVVLGRLRCRGLRRVSGATWRWVVWRALELPGLGTAPQPPDLPDRRPGIPYRAVHLALMRVCCDGCFDRRADTALSSQGSVTGHRSSNRTGISAADAPSCWGQLPCWALAYADVRA